MLTARTSPSTCTVWTGLFEGQGSPARAGSQTALRVVALVSQKGGVGKTTLCSHLAVAAERAGAGPVAVIDRDPQKSLTHWWNARESQSPAFATGGERPLAEDLEALAKFGVRLAFIDTNPTDRERLAEAVAHADLVVVPTRASPVDLRVVGATIDLIEEHGVPHVFALNGLAPRARLNRDVLSALSRHGQVAPVGVHQRVLFAACMLNGETVMDLDPTCAAATEIETLWDYVEERLAKIGDADSILAVGTEAARSYFARHPAFRAPPPLPPIFGAPTLRLVVG